MIAVDPYLLVRAGSVYVAAVLTSAVWLWRRPDRRCATGALLGAIWNVPAVLMLNVIAVRIGWWHFEAHGGLLLGVPVDLLLSWSVLWGAVPALAFPSPPLAAITAMALAADVALMPAGSPVVLRGACVDADDGSLPTIRGGS